MGDNRRGAGARSAGSERFIVQKAHERGVRVVELWVVDPLGRVPIVAVPIDALDGALEDGFAVSVEALGEAFGPAHGPHAERELVLAPEPSTFLLLPGDVAPDGPRVSDPHPPARMLCDLRERDGSPAALCSRTALKRALGRATQLGSMFYVGATIQHHWLARPDDDHALDDARRVRRLGQATAQALDALGIAWRAHYLGADGRFCLELDWVDPLTLADAIVTHRRVVHDVALEHGAAATFAPFPWAAPRTRLDLYVSLSRDGAPIFDDGLDPEGLAPAGRDFIEALASERGALELVMRSTLHSYQVPALPDIGRGPSGRGEGGTTVLVRGADACANPYTLLAVALGVGGEARDAHPPAPAAAAQTLLEAAHRASTSARVRDILGAPLIESLSSLGEASQR